MSAPGACVEGRAHHWKLAPRMGPTSPAICVHCNQLTAFRNHDPNYGRTLRRHPLGFKDRLPKKGWKRREPIGEVNTPSREDFKSDLSDIDLDGYAPLS